MHELNLKKLMTERKNTNHHKVYFYCSYQLVMNAYHARSCHQTNSL